MLSKPNYLLVIVLIVMSFVACNDEDCTSMDSNVLKLKFDSVTANGKILDKHRVFDGIYAVGYEDSIFHKNDSTTVVRLPLHPGKDDILFIFMKDNARDSLQISYKSSARFISADCGVEHIFSDIKVINSSFDSVNVMNDRLRRNAENNIKIIEIFE